MQRLFIVDKRIFSLKEELGFQEIFLNNNQEHEIYYFPNSLSKDFAETILENCNTIKICSMIKLFADDSLDVRFFDYLLQVRNKKMFLLPFTPNSELLDFQEKIDFSLHKTEINYYVIIYLLSKYIPYVFFLVIVFIIYAYIYYGTTYAVDISKKYFWLEYIKKPIN